MNSSQQHHPENIGIAIGVLLCGLLLLAFPKLTHMSLVWVAWVFYIVGLLVMCVGIIGTCVEAAKRW